MKGRGMCPISSTRPYLSWATALKAVPSAGLHPQLRGRSTLLPPSREETMANEPRDQRPKIRLSQLSHGAG